MRMVWVRLIGCRPLARASGRRRLTLRLAGVAFALAVVMPAALQVQTAMAVSVPRIYWGNDATNAIVAANLDGTNPNPNFATGAQNPGGLVVDGQHVYWSNFVTGTIGRANLNGTGVDPNFMTGLGHVEDVAVNDQHVYWADAVAGTIGEANLNGTDVNQSFITGANNPHGVAVDGQHIYWSDGDTNTIGEANLDGTDVNQSFITGASFPTMVRVDGQHIYWINFNLDTIGEANLDGSDVNEGFIGGANEVGLAVDGQHIYWDSSASTIGRANQDGTGVNQSFITTATFVAGLAVSVPIARVTPTRPAVFASTPVGALGPPRTLTITNAGQQDLSLSGLSFSGANPGDFIVGANGCLGPVAPGESCRLSVAFAPQAAGSRSATLQIATNDYANSPLQVPLSGGQSTSPERRGGSRKIELVACKTVTRTTKTHGHKHKTTALKCSTRLVSPKHTIRNANLAARVARAGVTYATGVAASRGRGRLQLLLTHRTRKLKPGRYTLTLTSHHKHHRTIKRKAMTLS